VRNEETRDFRSSAGAGWICMASSKIKRGVIYHLPADRGNYTLCGLRIGLLNLPKRFTGGKEESSSEGGALCKHCERIEKQDS